MKRDIKKEILTWKASQDRLPLLIRGARQVGKSYIIEEFGRQAFTNVSNCEF